MRTLYRESGAPLFPPFLAVAFIALKLSNEITWSWWWVLSPVWISAIVGIALWIVGFFITRQGRNKP